MQQALFALAIPNILSNLSVPLLSAVDTALMGHLESELYLGAIALGGIIFNFIYWGFGFLRMGTTGLTAQSYGEGDKKEEFHLLLRGLLIAILSGLVIVLFKQPIEEFGFSLLEGSPEVHEEARRYFALRIYAAPATLALYVMHGWFLGMQNAIYPLILTLLANVLNAIFNVYFVFGLGMTADGVALGTIVAQYLALILAAALFLRKYRDYLPRYEKETLLNWVRIKNMTVVNSNILIRTICLVFAFAYFTAESAKLGDELLAVNSILQQFVLIMAYAVDGFAFAAESLTGKFRGEKNAAKVRQAVRLSFVWGMLFALLFSLSYLLAGSFLFSLFTDLPNLNQLATEFLPWMVLFPLVAAACFIWDGIYIGTTETRALRNTMIFATFVIFIPSWLLALKPLGNHGLWLAFSLFMLARSASLTLGAKNTVYRVA